MMKIAIIDYGMGNLHSAAKALEKVGAQVKVTSDPELVRQADKVILPGVGAFGDCMKNLNERELAPVIHEVIAAGKPFLGICVGLQLLFEGSEEDPGVAGLGIFKGMVRKIAAPGLKNPSHGLEQPGVPDVEFPVSGTAAGGLCLFCAQFSCCAD